MARFSLSPKAQAYKDDKVREDKKYEDSSSDSSVSGLIHVYATNYNVLRILSGMGGLAYSN